MIASEEARTARQQEMLANRLRKRQKHLAKWAKREGTDAYRLYDRDIPEIPLAVDWYAGCLYLAGYARRGSVDEQAAPDEGSEAGERDGRAEAGEHEDAEERWLEAMRVAAADALSVKLEDTARKRRERKRGTAQYVRESTSGRRVVVREGGHRFYVNLWDYLDTGLFLDHRKTRALVAEACAGKRFLNLFSYTGSFGVYAAAAGATAVTQVDLSKTYLDWARDNLRLNELPLDGHELVRDDTLRFLTRAADEGRRFDVVVVDPPTFSNSKRMEGTFDVRRDHVELLASTRRVLALGGVVWFSTNARGFTLSDEAARPFASAVDVTAKTRSPDFADRHSHRAWRLTG